MNWWNRWPWPAEISTPAKPACCRITADSANSTTICATSPVVSACGTVQLRSSGSAEAPIASWMRPGWCRPRPGSWICATSSEPASRTAPAQRARPAAFSGARTLTFCGLVCRRSRFSGSVTVSAAPPRARVW